MLKYFINLFFPDVCAGCNAILQTNESVICTHCRHEIPLTLHHKNSNNEAVGKFFGKIDITFAGAMMQFHKKGIVQQLIHKLKYKGNQEIGTVIGAWYAQDLRELPVFKTINYIIPVPLHPKKFKERGYNQVTTFAQTLSTELNIPYDDSILVRNLYSKTQTKKTIFARSEIVQNIFGVCFNESHHNKHFLLIDDVSTTGSTLEACGRELLKIPGAKISVVCMAMSQ